MRWEGLTNKFNLYHLLNRKSRMYFLQLNFYFQNVKHFNQKYDFQKLTSLTQNIKAINNWFSKTLKSEYFRTFKQPNISNHFLWFDIIQLPKFNRYNQIKANPKIYVEIYYTGKLLSNKKMDTKTIHI